MAYQRKTRDEYQVQTYTGRQYGWEEVTAEETYTEARERLKEYRENEPQHPHRIKRVRVPLAALLALLLSTLPALAADTAPEKKPRPRPSVQISVKVYPEKFQPGGPLAGKRLHLSTVTKTTCSAWIQADEDPLWTAGLQACRAALQARKS